MEIQFTSSLMLAVDYAIRLAHGSLWVLPKGADDPTAFVKVESPVWCNFEFFSRIQASPVRRLNRVEPKAGETMGLWNLGRTVTFFHHSQIVAIAHLAGIKMDGGGEGIDNQSFWAVTKLGYFRSFCGGPDEPPEDWREIEFGMSGMRATRVA